MKYLAIFSFLFFTLRVLGQSADCQEYIVENITIPNDTTGIMEVTISNKTAMLAYLDLLVIDNAGDTIGKMDTYPCACLFVVPNSSDTFMLKTNLTYLPPFNTFRVDWRNGPLNCDSLSLSPSITSTQWYFPNKEVTVYPNPFNTSTSLEFENKNKEKHTLAIYNATGQLVRKVDNITTEKVEIERKNLTAGFYFFKLQNGNEIVGTGKLIIE